VRAASPRLRSGVPGLRCGGRRAGQLAHRHGLVVVRRAMPEVDVALPEVGVALPEVGAALPEVGAAVPRGGQGRERQPVLGGADGAVPAEVRAVGARTPAGRGGGHAADAGQHTPQRRGQPRLRCRQPDPGVQQVDREVGGELDRRLQLVVDRTLDGPGGDHRDGDRRGHGDRCRGGGRRAGDGRGGAGAELVDRQRRCPPGQVGAVRAGAPGAQPLPEAAPPAAGAAGRGGGWRRGGGDRRDHRDVLDVQDTDDQPDGQRGVQPASRARDRAVDVRLERQGRAGSEQAGPTREPRVGRVGPLGLRRLDRHVLPPVE